MRTFGLACLLALVLLISGCGNVFVRGSWNGGTQTVSGVVSIVQLTVVVDGDNVSTQVTVVTLTNNFGSSTVSFCGDQRTRLPLNEFVQATFLPGQPCSDLFNVVIKIH
ncbi:MAG: hypothetical protein LAO22_16985 [Acidobacteriia bacterium]|nr:hypothetical protein [Terriglobia bacterium]